MSRWLVTGAGGMLGQDLMAALATEDVTGLTRAQLDVTDPAAVREAVAGAEVVVNTAAWTDVDGAEAAERAAATVNGDGPRHLARACAATGARLLHVSTDYVFAGTAADRGADPRQASPYAEDEASGPATAYGRTKVIGERAVLEEHPGDGYVVRTAWLYGEHGRNFVRTMLDAEQARETLDVVDDQWGQPTWSADLAARLVALGRSAADPGIYHLTGAGCTTWCGLARAVFAEIGADPERVRPTTSDRVPRPAPRPAFSVLGAERWERTGLPAMPPWREALRRAIPQLTATRGSS